MKSFDFFSLDYIYFPVSGIMWIWHKLFGMLFGYSNPWVWVLSVVFLVFTLRSLLFKPFMGQMNSQMKMQAVAPELKKLREKYKGDRTRLAEEMQKFNKEAGVNPLGGCLPALIQAPVFIGLFHVLKMFKPGHGENYFFGASDVSSFVDSKLFGGAPLSSFMTMPLHTAGGQIGLAELGGIRSTVIAVGIPLTILAGIATFLTSRRSVARQQQMQGDQEAMPQAAIMNKLMKYVFPLFVVIGGPFFPLAILFYWLANNTWTFGQLYVAHRIQDKKMAEQSMVVEQSKEATRYSKPTPGARPVSKPAPGARPTQNARSGARPAPGKRPATTGGRASTGGSSAGSSGTAGSGTAGSSPISGTRAGGGKPRTGVKRPVVEPTSKPESAGSNGSGGLNGTASGSSNAASNGSKPSLRKPSSGSTAATAGTAGTTEPGVGGTPDKKKPGRR